MNGSKDFMAQFAPKLASLLQGEWIKINDSVSVMVPDAVDAEVTAAGGKTTVKFDRPLPISVTESWGPFRGKFSGTVDGVLEITAQGARLALGSLPDQTLEWAP